MRISSELFDFMANICQFLDLCIQSICLNLLCLSNRYELRKLLKFRVLFLHSFILPLGVLASKKYETKLGLLTLAKSFV